MADYWTHNYVGKKLMEKIGNVKVDENSFLLGCQGPDIFYYLRYAVHTEPPNLGELIHNEKTKEVFLKVFEYLKENNEIYYRSYVYGWVIHYILDKNIHPYIDNKKGYSHKRLEANIDTYVVDKYFNKSVFSMNSREILKVNDNQENIYLIYKKIASDIFKVSLTFEEYTDSIKHFRKIHKLFNGKNAFLRKTINFFPKIFNKDLSIYFYLKINEVSLPRDIEVVDEIINCSINEAEKIIIKINKYLINKVNLNELMNEFENINYSGII